MSDAHKTILERANKAVSAGDNEGFLAFCTDDTTWTFVGEQTLRGKQAVREWMLATYTTPPQFDVHRMIAEGNHLSVVGEITLPDDSGKRIRHAYCDVWRFEDDRLAELHAYVVELGPVD